MQMNNRIFYCSVAASFLIHAVVIPARSLMTRVMPATPVQVPIELVNLPRVEEVKTPEALPSQLALKAIAVKIAAPKLLSKPEINQTPELGAASNTGENIKEPEKPVEPKLASLPPEPGSVKGGWNVGERAGEAEGGEAGVGNLFGKGDVGAVNGS